MSPRRRGGPPTRPRQPAHPFAVHVFVEGEKTEAGYLLPWRRDLRDRVLITVDAFTGASPMAMVQRAVQTKAADRRDQARSRGRAFDEVWCVFDRDEHPNIPEALALAEQHGIGVAFSNPCIELWFILHFEDQTASIHRHDAQRRSATLLVAGKTLTPAAAQRLVQRYPEARRRAIALDAKHEGDGSPPLSNPSSTMWNLIDRFTSAAAQPPEK